MQDVGLKITNHWGATMAAAHLYNAVRSEAPNEGPWQDMESLISIHTSDYIFVGRRPNTAKEYFRRYQIATGSSAANFAPTIIHTRNFGMEVSRSWKPTRGLYSKAVVSRMFGFNNRFSSEEANPALTLANIEVLLHRVYKLQDRSLDKGLDNDLGKVIGGEYPENSAFVNKQYQKSQILTPLQILDMLYRTLYAERLHLAWNYIGLHDRATICLIQVHHEFKDMVYELTQKWINEDDGSLPMIASFTLGLLTGADAKIRADIISKVGNAMSTAIYDNIDVELEAMQNMLSAGYPYGPNPPWSKDKWLREQM